MDSDLNSSTSICCCKRRGSGYGRGMSLDSEVYPLDGYSVPLGPHSVPQFGQGTNVNKLNAKFRVDPIELESQFHDESMGAAIITFLSKPNNKGLVQWRVGRPTCMRMVALSRFKLWWMRPSHIDSASKIPPETQFLLGENTEALEDNKILYTLFVPLLDNNVKCSLKGTSDETIHIVAETGCNKTPVQESVCALLIAVGEDPFNLIECAMSAVKRHHASYVIPLGTTMASDSDGDKFESFDENSLELSLLRNNNARMEKYEDEKDERISTISVENQTYPSFVDYFGWCTWDSCYTKVNNDMVEAGLDSLSRAGIRVRWMVLDDGWQSVNRVDAPNGQQWRDRLTQLSANPKFQNLGSTVKLAKEKYNVDQFFVWHTIQGYWQGVEVGSEHLSAYDPMYQSFNIPPGISEIDPEMNYVKHLSNLLISKFSFMKRKYGFGLISMNKIHLFFHEYHEYLVSNGVDGVKVDAQSVINCLGKNQGGSVMLNRSVHSALSASVSRHFSESKIIHCMCHDNAILLQLPIHYSSRVKPIVRGSDDFYPRDEASHGTHIYANAFNGLMLAYIGALQDWDMFQTNIDGIASMHAASRAISGGPIYISDAPNNHNIQIIKKIVLEDGSVLRAKRTALPTLSSLFNDPQHNPLKPLLSLWNENPCYGHGVVGVFNVFGSTWNQKSRMYKFLRNHEIHQFTKEYIEATESIVSPRDCHFLVQNTEFLEESEFAIYLHNAQKLYLKKRDEKVSVGTLAMYKFEIAAISCVHIFSENFTENALKFSSIGLIDMYNAGGSILSENFEKKNIFLSVEVTIRGSGLFLVLCTKRPSEVQLITDSNRIESVESEYIHPSEVDDFGRLHVHIPSPFIGQTRILRIEFEYEKLTTDRSPNT